MNPAYRKTGKWLSYILRHHPETIGIRLDADGWVAVETLLRQAQAHGQDLSRPLLAAVVAHDDKQRFTFSADGRQIRAAQGHSTAQVAMRLPETCPPALLYHGTARRFLAPIRAQGLLPGSRHHVHLSADTDTARRVGSRHGAPVVLRVDAAAMQATGHVFYHSDNGVWLTATVPAVFLQGWPAEDGGEEGGGKI